MKTKMSVHFLVLSLGALGVASVTGSLGCGASDAGKGADSPTENGGVVGSPAPDFSVQAVTNGQGAVSLDSLRGKVVLLDFWGTFCEPCKKAFPKLQELNAKLASSGLKIVGISEDEADDKGKIPAFAQAYGAQFVLGWDKNKAIAKSYKPETMPTTFLIDKKGVVRFAHAGYRDGEEVEIEKEIKQLLDQ